MASRVTMAPPSLAGALLTALLARVSADGAKMAPKAFFFVQP
jgi:hypothetical protein